MAISAAGFRNKRAMNGGIPGLRGNNRTAKWQAKNAWDMPFNADVNLYNKDIVYWLAMALHGVDENAPARANHDSQKCYEIMCYYDGILIDPFLKGVRSKTTKPLVECLLQFWRECTQKESTFDRIGRVKPEKKHELLYDAAVKFANAKYTALGAIWSGH